MGLIINKGNKQLPSAQDYSEHLSSKPITALTTVEYKHGKNAPWVGGVADEVTVHPGLFVSHGMKIAIEGGRTLSLGNFEFARVGVTLTVPCDPESLEEAYNWGTSWISDKIEAETKLAKNG